MARTSEQLVVDGSGQVGGKLFDEYRADYQRLPNLGAGKTYYLMSVNGVPLGEIEQLGRYCWQVKCLLTPSTPSALGQLWYRSRGEAAWWLLVHVTGDPKLRAMIGAGSACP